MRTFRNRQEAGQELAARLMDYRSEEPVVLGLPRGGVPVADEVAKALDAPLDVIVVRKLGAPRQPELAIGAVGPRGVRVLNEDIVEALGVDERTVDRLTKEKADEVAQRIGTFRGDAPYPDLADETIILVDDGIATGSTAKAGIQVLRQMGARRVVLAVPVIPPDTVHAFEDLVDDLVYVEAPAPFMAVGAWYEDFGQTPDQEVVATLDRAAARTAGRLGGATTGAGHARGEGAEHEQEAR